MSAASVVITPQPIELTIAALQALWATPNPVQTPAASPGLILDVIHASCETTDDHEDETKKVKAYGPVSSSPGPWLSEGIVDSLQSDQIPKLPTKAEQSRYERLRLAELRRVSSLYFLKSLTQHEIVKKTGRSLKEASEQMALVREIGAAK